MGAPSPIESPVASSLSSNYFDMAIAGISLGHDQGREPVNPQIDLYPHGTSPGSDYDGFLPMGSSASPGLAPSWPPRHGANENFHTCKKMLFPHTHEAPPPREDFPMAHHDDHGGSSFAIDTGSETPSPGGGDDRQRSRGDSIGSASITPSQTPKRRGPNWTEEECRALTAAYALHQSAFVHK